MDTRGIGLKELAVVFVRIGARAFGGWPTTTLLLEKEFVDKRGCLTQQQVYGAVAYAQILPGATQVAIVSNVGFRLRGVRGAVTATCFYLLPAVTLFVLFGWWYFRFGTGSYHMESLVATLGGVILATAFKIGHRHADRTPLWGLAFVAFAARLWLHVNTVIIILLFGGVGLLTTFMAQRKSRV
jgi:chromate transporter